MKIIPEIRRDWYLQIVVLGLICFTFLNMLYCTMGYEFGFGPMTFLSGPEDRFADILKLSLSFRSVTLGVDKTESFQTWKPIYQGYYEHPVYGGKENLAIGELTHFHHPPLSILIFLLCGIFIVQTGSPPLMLLLFFCIYLLEVWTMIWIGIPRPKRTLGLILAIWFLCLASYPALVTFGRANYVNAGLTTIPIVAFLIATFAQKQASLASLLALALAVNIHPNAIIFLLALPLALGIRRAIKPSMQFIAFALALFGASYFSAHKLYPDYTIANFRKGVAIYGNVYISGGAGIRNGSSLFGLVRVLNHGLHLGISFPVEMGVFYVLATFIFVLACAAVWRASVRRAIGSEHQSTEKQTDKGYRGGLINESNQWPLPLVPFFLVSFYCILSPIFADYHLLVFVAPLVLAYLERDEAAKRSQLLTVVAIASVLMLSPKNYLFQHASVQIILNPVIVCGVVLWLALELLSEARQRSSTPAVFHAAEGR